MEVRKRKLKEETNAEGLLVHNNSLRLSRAKKEKDGKQRDRYKEERQSKTPTRYKDGPNSGRRRVAPR